jgi:hypothetical protein
VSCVEVTAKRNEIKLTRAEMPDQDNKVFTFEAVYGIESTQRMVYDETAFPLVESVI